LSRASRGQWVRRGPCFAKEEIEAHFSRARRAAQELVHTARPDIELIACPLLMCGTLSGGEVAGLLTEPAPHCAASLRVPPMFWEA
jgi:hypothetical protein